MVFKIEIERDMCISCGNCIDECEKLFKFADDDLAMLIDGEINDENFSIREYGDISCGMDAAELCPAECIIVYDDEDEVAP